MAKLIPLFTQPSWETESSKRTSQDKIRGYFGLKPHVVNMSAVKPNTVFGPLFLGINLPNPRLDVPSILTLTPEGAEPAESTARTGENGQSKKAPTGVFILDELNSLDVDLQGVLLRVLENGEVTPLFDIRTTDVRHLVIGIVNEDPEVLTRESETRKLESIKELTGAFLGNALYEFLVKGRRLRPDLFYRLKRGLYLKLPPLRDRREDIPILFYFECDRAVRQEMETRSIGADGHGSRSPHVSQKEDLCVYVELNAYESLMHPALDWPGNIRQLQSIATEVAVLAVEKALEDSEKQQCDEPPGIVRVSDETVRKVLGKHFPRVFGSDSSNTQPTGEEVGHGWK